MRRIELLLWALGHDLKPRYLLTRMRVILTRYCSIWLTSLVYFSVSSWKLGTLPFEPLRVAVMATYHALVHRAEVEALRKTVEERHARKAKRN